MIEIAQKIFDFLKMAWKRQGYEYRFLSFNGSEQNKQLKVANSIEYEFINSGNSYVIINTTLILYPAFMGIEPSRVKFSVNKNEEDLTVYNYDFIPLENNEPVLGFYNANNTSQALLLQYNPIPSVGQFNKLQVIVKQVSRQ